MRNVVGITQFNQLHQSHYTYTLPPLGYQCYVFWFCTSNSNTLSSSTSNIQFVLHLDRWNQLHSWNCRFGLSQPFFPYPSTSTSDACLSFFKTAKLRWGELKLHISQLLSAWWNIVGCGGKVRIVKRVVGVVRWEDWCCGKVRRMI